MYSWRNVSNLADMRWDRIDLLAQVQIQRDLGTRRIRSLEFDIQNTVRLEVSVRSGNRDGKTVPK